MSALPREARRFNYQGRTCPRCYRPNLAVRGGLYECVDGGCAARFRFIAATSDTLATLERVIDDTPYNAGARRADDLVCLGCGARGHTFCPSCSSRQSREAGR